MQLNMQASWRAIVSSGTCLFLPFAAIPFQFETIASWYGPGFQGRKTASGEPFDQNKLTAASRTLPFGTRLTVKNIRNGRHCEVVINDRGPYVKGRGIDLSHEAARRIGMVGVAPVVCCSAGITDPDSAAPAENREEDADHSDSHLLAQRLRTTGRSPSPSSQRRALNRSSRYLAYVAYEGAQRIKVDPSSQWNKFVHTYRGVRA